MSQCKALWRPVHHGDIFYCVREANHCGRHRDIEEREFYDEPAIRIVRRETEPHPKGGEM